jgi:hypothetical protein
MRDAPFRNHLGLWAFVFVAITGGAACGDNDQHGVGTSGASCPGGNTLTYDSFGRNFMAKYCLGCHSSSKMGADRQGAPADHNFDTLSAIRTFAAHIDERAAAGPSAVNTAMPPIEPKPTEEERRHLGQWLACETSDDDGGGGGTGDSGGGAGDSGAGDSGTGDSGTGDGGSRGDGGGTQDARRDTAVGDTRGGG